MRKILAFISILLAAAMMSGCYPDGTVSQISLEQSNDEPFDHHVQAQYGEITLDYMIPDEYPTEVPKITITKKNSWDREKIVSFILGDQPYKLSTEPIGDPDPHTFIYTVAGPTSSRNTNLYIDKGYLSYMNGYRYYNEYMQGSVGGTYIRMRQYASNEQLSFLSKDAIARANEYLELLGITNYGDPLVIPISKERADRLYEYTGGGYNYATLPEEGGQFDPAVPWTEEQEFYGLIYQLEYNGLKVNDGAIRFNGMGGTAAEGMNVTAFVDRNEVFYLDASDIGEPEPEASGVAPINCSPKQASDALQEFLEKRVNSTKQVIYKCCLEYVPFERVDVNDRTSNKVIYVPAWVFYGYEETGRLDRSPQCSYLFYAETGVRYGSSF